MTWSSLVIQDIDNCAFPQHQSELPRSASSSSMIMARRRELLGLFSVFVLVVSAFFYIPSLLTIIVYSCQLRHLQALFQGSFGCATFCGGREIAASAQTAFEFIQEIHVAMVTSLKYETTLLTIHTYPHRVQMICKWSKHGTITIG